MSKPETVPVREEIIGEQEAAALAAVAGDGAAAVDTTVGDTQVTVIPPDGTVRLSIPIPADTVHRVRVIMLPEDCAPDDARIAPLAALQDRVARLATECGWRDGPQDAGDVDTSQPPILSSYFDGGRSVVRRWPSGAMTALAPNGVMLRPRGWAIRYAEEILRMLDVCQAHGVDLAGAIEATLRFHAAHAPSS
jgi:hypothetical protein